MNKEIKSRPVLVSILPKTGNIRLEDIEPNRTFTFDSFMFDGEKGPERIHFFSEDTGEPDELTLTGYKTFDLNKEIDKKNLASLTAFKKQYPGMFDIEIDDPHAKEIELVGKTEMLTTVLEKIVAIKDDLSMQKAILRRVSSGYASAVGSQSMYPALLKLAQENAEIFFVNEVFVSESETFRDYKFIDDLIENSILSIEDKMFVDMNGNIMADNMETLRYKINSDSKFKVKLTQMLEIKESKGTIFSMPVIPEPKKGTVNLSQDFSLENNKGLTTEEALLASSKKANSAVSKDDVKSVVDEAISKEKIWSESNEDGSFSYKLNASGLAFDYEQLLNHVSQNVQIFNGIKDAIGQNS